ncbi:MAG: UvrD-helicase domain-containing protein [Puniceicoccales bacterium]|jgi:ATP-dependent exoDNAse (exonuclease V) beta subunit|nr:UvrD-helicase domain-containing protein [Puniceicoccales bacterium]
MQLLDRLQRDSFAEEITKNFSVIASAGAGKTTAITERIANFAMRDSDVVSNGGSRVKRLVAVTYTEKAAKEIKDRVFSKIFQKTEHSHRLHELCIQHLESAFFGTIHAFASKFLKSHCAIVGLPSDFKVVQDEESLWEGFIASVGNVLKVIPQSMLGDFLCTHDIDKLLIHARNHNPADPLNSTEISPMPAMDIDGILAYKSKGNEGKSAHFLHLLREWDLFRKNGDYFPMPDCSEICNNHTLIELCQSELKDFLSWKRSSEKFFIEKISRLYGDFRIGTGQLKYEDLINLSIDLLKHPTVIGEIEKDPYRVILDEAQDTDVQQFRLLLGISQKNLHEGISMDILKNFPDHGHFSMVGDPQQSIYCDRADIKTYVALHDLLIASNAAHGLTFSVTMRCSEAVINFVNDRFQTIFNGIKFVHLVPKPDSRRGEVKILKLQKQTGENVQSSASQTAALFLGKTPADFGVENWADIAILAPRKDWLADIYQCFVANEDLPCAQLHFDNANGNSASPIRWLASCLRYVNNPADQREFAGILREIFGIKSQEIVNYFRYGNDTVCAKIDAEFTDMRSERYGIPLAKFLLKILDRFKIFHRIFSLNIYAEENLSTKIKQTIELCYFAESNQMNIIGVEQFLTDKIDTLKESNNVNSSAIQFVTFHKSKGLEWPMVVLPFMYRKRQLKGNIRTKSLSNEQQFSELYANECRLLYVSCTRAKNKLLILDDSEIFDEKTSSNMVSSGEILLERVVK